MKHLGIKICYANGDNLHFNLNESIKLSKVHKHVHCSEKVDLTHFVLNRAAFTAIATASNKLPPHSSNWKQTIVNLIQNPFQKSNTV